MKIGTFFKIYATRLAFACALIAILLFSPASLTASAGLRAFLIVLILLFLLIGAAFVFYANRRNAGEIHYFLFDRRRNRFYRREELNAEIIQDAMAYYLQDFIEDELLLWTDIPKPLRLQLEGEEQFCPLAMYRMLALLSKQEPERAAAVFGTADERVVTYLCHVISECGDREMADYIYHLKKNFVAEKDRITMFFTKNKNTFAARILRYTNQHFDDFYVARSRLGK